jgi:hypothetical protein
MKCLFYRATHVIDESGWVTRLDARFPDKREALAKQLLTPTVTKHKTLNGVKKVRMYIYFTDCLSSFVAKLKVKLVYIRNSVF